MKKRLSALIFMLVGFCSLGASCTPLSENLRNPNGGVMVAAHRACWHHAPENSLRAIRNCIALGVDIVEVDVHRSADNKLVLMHDDSVDRMTNGKGLVSDLTFQQLKALKLRNRKGAPGTKFTNEKIPTLKQVYELAKGKILVNVDAKSDVYAEAVDLAKSLDMANQIIIKMETPATDPELESLRGVFSQTNFMAKITQGDQLLSEVAFSYVSYRPVAYEVKAKSDSYLSEGAKEMAKMGTRLWVNTMSETPEKCAGHVDKLALKNPDENWGYLVALGVSLIQTNEPKALLDYLNKRRLRK